MTDEIAIVERAQGELEAAVRAAFSALREAEAQEAKAERRASDARDASARRRIDLGKALIRIRSAWPASGPRARGWGEFLAREGIESQRASELMRYAGYVATNPPAMDEQGGEISNPPTYADAGIKPRADAESPAISAGSTDGGNRDIPLVAPVGFDLRLGDWRSALADVGMVDAIITDAPYGARTHASRTTRADGVDPDGLTPSYPPWTVDEVDEFVNAWSPMARGWMVALTDDSLIPAWRAAYRRNGRVDFAPVPCVITGMTVRIQGDGPSSWAVYAMVSRPSALSTWGTLDGAHVGPRVSGAENGRGKPPWLLDKLIGEYTRPGDLVCDPLAGYGSTLISALALGRRAVGAERDPGAFQEALRRASALITTNNQKAN